MAELEKSIAEHEMLHAATTTRYLGLTSEISQLESAIKGMHRIIKGKNRELEELDNVCKNTRKIVLEIRDALVLPPPVLTSAEINDPDYMDALEEEWKGESDPSTIILNALQANSRPRSSTLQRPRLDSSLGQNATITQVRKRKVSQTFSKAPDSEIQSSRTVSHSETNSREIASERSEVEESQVTLQQAVILSVFADSGILGFIRFMTDCRLLERPFFLSPADTVRRKRRW